MEHSINREDLLTEMNRPFGHTEADRIDKIPFLLVQMEKDIEHIIAAYKSSIGKIRSLKGIANILGSKACLKELETSTKALSFMKSECNNILILTRNKTYSKCVESRFSVLEEQKRKKDEATKVALANIKGGNAIVKSRKGIKAIEHVERIIARQNHIQTSIQMKKTAREVTPSKITQKKTRSSEAYDYCATITLTNHKEAQIPAPEHDTEKAVYTIRELCTHLLQYDGQGLKRIVGELKQSGRCLVSPSTFLTHYNKYKEENVLPSISDYGGTYGRKPILNAGEAPQVLNTTIHENTSYTEDGIESTKRILIETKKRKAEELGRFEHTSELSRYTVRVFDRLATTLDPNCSKTPAQSARLKSENREIMSRSVRTCFSSAVSCIATSFKKGSMDPSNYGSLSPGCSLAMKVARECFQEEDIVPIHLHNTINSDDIGRFVMEGLPSQPSVQKKTMKTSKNSTARTARKSSSLWKQASPNDNYSSGMKVKFKSLISASGHTAPICIHFYGLTDTDIKEDFIILEVPGLCIGGDVIPNRYDVGYVILTKGSHDENTESDVTLTERVLKWYHNKIVVPFIYSLRTMNEIENSLAEDSVIGGGDLNFDWTVFSLDSEISYLNFLRRRETIDFNKERRILVKKISAAATESYQALDCGECFLELSSQLKKGTMKNSSSSLSKMFMRILNECPSFVMRNKSKLGAMVDAISCAPYVYKHAFEKQKIQQSFCCVGEITNIGSRDSPKYIACPDIDVIQKQCKITWTSKERDHFNSNLKSGVAEIMRNGYISEEWFDERGFPKDSRINGDEIERNYSLQQMHMQRHVLLSNSEIASYFRDVEERSIRKQQNASDNLYASANQIIKLNDRATEELTKFISSTQSNGSVHLEWNNLTLQQMHKITVEKLRAFYLVRTSENLIRSLSEKNPKLKKGTPEQVNNESVPPNGESLYHLGRAFAVRNKPVIASAPGRAPQIKYSPSLIQLPSTYRLEAKSNFNVTADFIRKTCVSISLLDDRGEDFQLQQIQNIAELDDNTFSDVLCQRLSVNLQERGCPMDHVVWKNFFIPNLKRGAAIVKMHGCVLNNTALPGQGTHDSLFSNSFKGDKTECLSGRDGALLDDIPDQLGAYLFEDENGIGICRAGSASVGLRKRYNGHVTASKRESPDSNRSNFYNCYPDKSSNGGKTGIKGNFEDLRQITGVRFKAEMMDSVTELLEWDDVILSFLENRGTGSLLEKKNRMVCYFFEKIFDLMIGQRMNLSRNPGFETFLGIWSNSSIERI